MSLVIIGIDEAGYGPMLGPLCVGMAAFRVHDWKPGDPAPDLWTLLAAGVCRKPGDKRGRVAIEDSKKLKLANDAKRHPLTHLERGVLAMLATQGLTASTDAEVFAALGVELEPHAWYGGEAIASPKAGDAAGVGIDANRLSVAMASAGVELIALRCCAIGERRFNALVREAGTKAATTAMGLGEHVRWAWEHFGDEVESGGPRVVCDRQGGRTAYAHYLADLMPRRERGEPIRIVVNEETDRQCRYEVIGPTDEPRRMNVLFRPEAESAYLPVALASMAAKYVRESAMARFNRYWSERAIAAGAGELKPTAGYVQDGRRWLNEVRGFITGRERAEIVRIA